MIPEKQIIIELLSVLFKNTKIYLFGSRARKTHQQTSDIDLALDTGKRLSSLDIMKAKNVLNALNIPQTIDIVDMHSIPKKLHEIILKEGILWND